MKDISQITAGFVDSHGLYQSLARRLIGENGFKRVIYSDPSAEDCETVNEAVIGETFPPDDRFEAVNDLWLRKKEIDLYVVPDSKHMGLQLELSRQGKSVWGSHRSMRLEHSRELFLKALADLGMEVPKFERIIGTDALRRYLADKEDRIIKISTYRGCFDDQTEILTDQGWYAFSRLPESCKVATMDMKSRGMEYLAPSARISYWYDGPMTSIKGRAMDALVTPNHCLWVKSGPAMKEWKYRPVFELAGRSSFMMPRASLWDGAVTTSVTVPRLSTRATQNTAVPMRRWAEFLGWFCAEGSLTLAGRSRTKYRVTLSQSAKANPVKHKELLACLRGLGLFTIQTEGGNGFSMYDKGLYHALAEQCYTPAACDCGKRYCAHRKRVPEIIKASDPETIKLFLANFLKGDGCVSNGQNRFYTSSRELAGDIQTLLLLTGKTGSIRCRKPVECSIKGRKICSTRPQYAVSQINQRDAIIRSNRMSQVNYSGFVHDVTVAPYHSIYVRRNGKAFWSGNSMETKKWVSMDEDEAWLDMLAVKLGGVKRLQPFLVFESIDTPFEMGGDTYVVRGKAPGHMLDGYECKDNGYFAAFKPMEKMPEQIRAVLEAFLPLLRGHANFWTMEVRVKGDHFYFIDNTPRGPLPGTASQCQLYRNLPEIIAAGAEGEIVEPEAAGKFAAEVALTKKGWDVMWRSTRVPKALEGKMFLSGFCEVDGRSWFPYKATDDDMIGWLSAIGDTPTETVQNILAYKELLPPGVDAQTDSLVDLIKEINQAEKEGMEFTEHPMPEPEIVVKSDEH